MQSYALCHLYFDMWNVKLRATTFYRSVGKYLNANGNIFAVEKRLLIHLLYYLPEIFHLSKIERYAVILFHAKKNRI
jgi:hypothetical protein